MNKKEVEYSLLDRRRICYYGYSSEDSPVQCFSGNHFGLYKLQDNETSDIMANLKTDPINTLQARTQWPIDKDGHTRYAEVILDFQSSYTQDLPYIGYRSRADLKLTALTWENSQPAETIELPHAVYWYSGSKRSVSLIVVIGVITDELEKEILEDNDIYLGDYEEDNMSRRGNVKYFNQERADKVENLG